MTQPTILVVEDNPISLKLLQAILEGGQYSVLGASDGHTALDLLQIHSPSLIVQDFILPDMSGIELFKRIRGTRHGRNVPVALLTGLVSHLDELQAAGQFAAVLAKPIEPSRLLQAVASLLAAAPAPPKTAGASVLVIDDEPLNRKLAQVQLSLAGYKARLAATVEEGLTEARRAPPDVILADVLMPGLDGFQLCLAARREPKLARVPIVLISSAYAEEEDRRLAHQAGAVDLVLRTPTFDHAIKALVQALESGAAPPQPTGVALAEDYLSALRRQVDRQAETNRVLIQRSGIQTAALSMIGALAQALARPREIPALLGDVLVHCLDAAGLSSGLLYLRQPDGRLTLHAATGLPSVSRSAADRAFGHPELLMRAHGDTQPAPFSTLPATSPAEREFLNGIGQRSVLVVPFVVADRHYGTLVLGSDSHDLTEPGWQVFARALGTQFGQTVALGQAMAETDRTLTDTAARLRALMDHASDGISVLSLTGLIQEVNHRMAEILGQPASAVVGRHMRDFPSPETAAAKVSEFADAVARGAGAVLGVEIRRPDGTTAIVDFSIGTVDLGSERVVLSIGRDVTEQRSVEQQLRQAQKMEAVGRLAGGVAHDFNNILTAVFGYADLLAEQLPPGSAARSDLDEIQNAAKRAEALTRQLLAFSRQQVLQPVVLNLNEVVENLEKMLHRILGEDVELATSLAPELGNVNADPGQIEQVILNLAVNARDAMATGGKLTIETANAELDVTYAHAHAGVSPGQYVLLAVSDKGIGIDEATKARIFEPFFTTKAEKGTGLGLATVHGIVNQSGGHIQVYSEPGHGATFKVYLPRVDAPVEAFHPAPTGPTLAGHETVLLAEDDDSLRALARTLLTKLGYTVLEAKNADEALAVARDHRGEIHLLLSDVVMPGRSGPQLASGVLEHRPGLRVLYMSGYTDEAIMRHGLLERGLNYLQKPFTPAALARKVREMLDAN